MKFLLIALLFVMPKISHAELFILECAPVAIGNSSSVNLVISVWVDDLGTPRQFKSILNETDKTNNVYRTTKDFKVFQEHVSNYLFLLGLIEFDGNTRWIYEGMTPFNTLYGKHPWKHGQTIPMELKKLISTRDQFGSYKTTDIEYFEATCLVE